MKGREIVSKFSFLINLLKLLVKIIPKMLFNILWNVLRGSESKLALLVRYLYVNKYSKQCGDNVFIGCNVILKNVDKLVLGSNVSIHANTYIDSAGEVHIGDNVSIANQTTIISFDHTWSNKQIPIKYNEIKLGKVFIDDDVWIGAGCRILSDVLINSRSIVAAGAVVNKDVYSNTIVGGIPAKKIKEI